MASSDLSVLVDMGFEKERAELAVKKTGGCEYTLYFLISSSYIQKYVFLTHLQCRALCSGWRTTRTSLSTRLKLLLPPKASTKPKTQMLSHQRSRRARSRGLSYAMCVERDSAALLKPSFMQAKRLWILSVHAPTPSSP